MSAPNVDTELLNADIHTTNAQSAISAALGQSHEIAAIRMAEAQAYATLAVASSVAALVAALRDA